MPSYSFEAYAEVGIWAYRTAGWQLVTTQQIYTTAGSQAFQEDKVMPWSISNYVYQLGSDVQKVGVTIQSYSGTGASITGFTKLAWQAAGSSGGVRSATPNGEKTTVTVSP